MSEDLIAIRVNRAAWLDMVRATVRDPYARILRLFNMGVRGSELW